MSERLSVTAESRALVIMAKRPQAGSTKTRLAPHMDLDQAAALYELFLHQTIAASHARTDCTPVIAIDRPDSAGYFAELAPGTSRVLQVGVSLGPRLDAVLGQCLDDGFGQAVAIGSDSPDLPSGHLTEAFALLDDPDTDVVFGPTDDGGYYLIGWKRRWSPVVCEVTMSTPTVLEDSLAVCERIGARVALAPAWYDVDEPDDLARLQRSPNLAAPIADFLASI
ncbi:MAG: TIGR04282 family arsenosugar biosynthesis glycosyltransferase [Actinomycetota bacterium]